MNIDLNRYMVTLKKIAANPVVKACCWLGLVIGLSLLCRVVLADSSTDTLDLSALDDAVGGQIKGGYGKLCFYIAIIWVVANVCIGKLGWKLVMIPAALLFAVAFLPDIGKNVFTG